MTAAAPATVFHGLVYGSMLIANAEIQAACERAALELPGIVERIRLIDAPRTAESVAA